LCIWLIAQTLKYLYFVFQYDSLDIELVNWSETARNRQIWRSFISTWRTKITISIPPEYEKPSDWLPVLRPNSQSNSLQSSHQWCLSKTWYDIQGTKPLEAPYKRVLSWKELDPAAKHRKTLFVSQKPHGTSERNSKTEHPETFWHLLTLYDLHIKDNARLQVRDRMSPTRKHSPLA
jgi:hypothetical protein